MLNKYGINKESYFYHEMESAALWGLWRAAQQYNPARGAFSTLAYTAISRQLIHATRTENNYRKRVMSTLDNQISDKEGDPLISLDIIPAKENIDEDVLCQEAMAAIKAIMIGATNRQREIIWLRTRGYSQPKIAARLGTTQTYVSQVLRKFRKMVHEMID